MDQTQAIPPATAAVQRCCEAYFRVRDENPLPPRISRQYDIFDAEKIHEMASDAYRRAMPLCDSWENIPAFMAAVMQGMVLQVFDRAEGSRLMYGASVITSRLRPPAESRSAGRGNKPTPLPSIGNQDSGDSGNNTPFRLPSPEMQAKLIKVLTSHGVPVPSEAALRHYPQFAAALFHLGGAYMYQEIEEKLNPLPPQADPPLAAAA
jgi:hypothetical protein